MGIAGIIFTEEPIVVEKILTHHRLVLGPSAPDRGRSPPCWFA